MPLDRPAAETALDGLVGPLHNLVHVEMRRARKLEPLPIAPTGSNPLFNHAIGWAATLAGAPPDDPTAVTSADLARLAPSAFYTFLDLAEYRLIATALNGFVMPDEGADGRNQSWAGLRGQFAARLSELEATLRPVLQTVRHRLGSGALDQGISAPAWASGEYGVDDRPPGPLWGHGL